MKNKSQNTGFHQSFCLLQQNSIEQKIVKSKTK